MKASKYFLLTLYLVISDIWWRPISGTEALRLPSFTIWIYSRVSWIFGLMDVSCSRLQEVQRDSQMNTWYHCRRTAAELHLILFIFRELRHPFYQVKLVTAVSILHNFQHADFEEAWVKACAKRLVSLLIYLRRGINRIRQNQKFSSTYQLNTIEYTYDPSASQTTFWGARSNWHSTWVLPKT